MYLIYNEVSAERRNIVVVEYRNEVYYQQPSIVCHLSVFLKLYLIFLFEFARNFVGFYSIFLVLRSYCS